MIHPALMRGIRATLHGPSRVLPLARRYAAAFALMLITLVGLEWGLPAAGVPTYLIPTPSRVWMRLTAPGDLLAHSLSTASAAMLGLSLGALFGVILALAFVRLRLLEDVLYPWVLLSQAVPVAALAPLLTIWLGHGLAPRVAMAALFAFFPVLVSTMRGLRDVSPEQLGLLRSWGARPRDVFVHLRIPASLPAVFAGLKVASALAVVGAIVSELAGGGRGLGFVVSVASYHLQTDRVFAAVVVAASISLALHSLIAISEWIVVFWRRGR